MSKNEDIINKVIQKTQISSNNDVKRILDEYYDDLKRFEPTCPNIPQLKTVLPSLKGLNIILAEYSRDYFIFLNRLASMQCAKLIVIYLDCLGNFNFFFNTIKRYTDLMNSLIGSFYYFDCAESFNILTTENVYDDTLPKVLKRIREIQEKQDIIIFMNGTYMDGYDFAQFRSIIRQDNHLAAVVSERLDYERYLDYDNLFTFTNTPKNGIYELFLEDSYFYELNHISISRMQICSLVYNISLVDNNKEE